jgi:dTDP-4-amino-4,6-dideoxygalactose transaminase
MITKSPTSAQSFKKNIYFTNSARVAFSHILKLIEFKEKDILLVPAYIGYTDREGSGVFDPITENNIIYSFYPILENMKIDLDQLEQIIIEKQVKAILLIHYFGFLYCDILKLKEICVVNDVLLIEDCAHTIYSTFDDKYFGNFGDFSFYSIHKVLPVDSGGFFKINNSSYFKKNLKIQNHEKIELESLETLASYNEDLAIKKIKENYTYMASELTSIDGLKVLVPNLPVGIVPMNLPVYILGMKREEFYFKMIEKGITLIALYYRLIDAIDKEIFKISYDISNNIINFPINQDITKDEMIEIIVKTKAVLNEFRNRN